MVKWADTEKERLTRKAQKAQSLASSLAGVDPTQHPSLFGAMPMGYISPYNGYGYQVCFDICLTVKLLFFSGFLFAVRNHYRYGFNNSWNRNG